MTFITNNKIVCVGKYKLERKATQKEINGEPLVDVEYELRMLLQNGDSVNIATLDCTAMKLFEEAINKQGPNANHIPLPTSSSPIYFYLKKSRQIFPRVDNFKIL